MLKRFSVDIWQHACFDPGTMLMAGSLAASAVGTGMQAAGTIAGGNAAAQAGAMQQQAANYQAAQDQENAGQAFAAGQRQMLSDQDKTRLAISSLRAGAGAAGVDPGTGTAATLAGSIARRGSYNAAMDMFNGASTATGLQNKAQGEIYTGQADLIGGQEAQSASQLAALGTIAGGAGSLFKGYGQYPASFKTS
jgi:hypothetical protein